MDEANSGGDPSSSQTSTYRLTDLQPAEPTHESSLQESRPHGSGHPESGPEFNLTDKGEVLHTPDPREKEVVQVVYLDVQGEEVVMASDQNTGPSSKDVIEVTVQEMAEQVANEVVPNEPMSSQGSDEPTSDQEMGEAVPEGEPEQAPGGEPELVPEGEPEDTLSDLESMAGAPSHYSVVEGSSQRQKSKLIDTRGYTYTKKRESRTATYWRCSVRNKSLCCPATVVERNGEFKVGTLRHLHPSQPADVVKFLLVTKMREKAKSDLSKRAGEIVNEVLAEQLGPCGQIPGLPTKGSLIRRVNRIQEREKPDAPMDMDFKLRKKLLPDGFVRQDIRCRGLRHIMMATDLQLHHLRTARRWYVDVIVKNAPPPFTQLLSISCFAKKISDIQLVPICFVLMSSQKAKDYKAVFRAIKDSIHTYQVLEVVLDYEQSLWKAFGEVFEGCDRKGSLTHWKQSIRWKIHQVGLSKTYDKGKGQEYKTLSQLMALPYLPAHLIYDTYQNLKSRAQNDKLEAVFEYVSDLWIEDELWTPQVWSVYNESVVWFNNFAGWRKNVRATSSRGYNFYRLVKVLYQQSSRFNLFVVSVREKKMKKLQQNRFKGTQYYLGIWWKDYKEGRLTTEQLLEACGQLFGDEPINPEGAAEEKE